MYNNRWKKGKFGTNSLIKMQLNSLLNCKRKNKKCNLIGSRTKNYSKLLLNKSQLQKISQQINQRRLVLIMLIQQFIKKSNH